MDRHNRLPHPALNTKQERKNEDKAIKTKQKKKKKRNAKRSALSQKMATRFLI